MAKIEKKKHDVLIIILAAFLGPFQTFSHDFSNRLMISLLSKLVVDFAMNIYLPIIKSHNEIFVTKLIPIIKAIIGLDIPNVNNMAI
jgi:hypothetical protein